MQYQHMIICRILASISQELCISLCRLIISVVFVLEASPAPMRHYCYVQLGIIP